MANVSQQLKDQISAGKIVFDSPATKSERLKQELLQENQGTRVTDQLQSLVLELSNLVSTHIRVSSIIREGDGGHPGLGRAVDLGNEEVAGQLLPLVGTDAEVAALKIDELIFDAQIAGKTNRNEWNYDQGHKHDYGTSTLNQHRNHIHFSVKE